MNKNIIIKNFCLSLVVFSLAFVFSLSSFPNVIFFYIIYPLYILWDTVLLTRKYGFNYWILLTSSCVYMITVLIYALIYSLLHFELVISFDFLSIHVIYLVIACIIGFVGMYIGKISKDNC